MHNKCLKRNTSMEKNEVAPKKESKLKRFYDIITLKGATYEGLLLAIALALPGNILLPWTLQLGFDGNWPSCVAVFLIYGVVLVVTTQLASNFIDEFAKWLTPWKWPNRIIGAIAIFLFSPLGIMMIAWLGLKKHRPWAVITSIVGLILFLYAQFVCIGYLPLRPLALFLTICSSPLFVMAGIVSAGEQKIRQNIIKISFAIAVVTGIIRIATEYPIVKHLTEAPAKMDALLADYRQTHSINVQECDESLLEKEPLKNVVSLMQALGKQFVWEQSISNTQAGIQKQYTDISKKSEGVREAIIALAAMPPRPVTHTQPVSDESSHPFTKSLPEAARFLAIEMMANAQQADLVKQDNAAMINLRDWCLQQESSQYDKAYGRTIEGRRLEALARTLPQNRYTEAEWLEMLGNEPDWRYIAACAYKLEADSELSQADYFNKMDANSEIGPLKSYFIRWIANSYYCGIHPWISGMPAIAKRLFMNPIAYKQKDLAQFVNLSLDEKNTMDDARKLDAIHDTYKWPIFLKPGTFFYSMPFSIQDARRMAMISWKIMEYSREHQGALPENLAQINEAPVSALNGLPFVYEHGDIEVLSDGGDGMITIRGFRLFIPNEEHAAKPNWKKARLSMIIPLE